MAFFSKLDGENQQVQRHIRLCDHRLKEAQNSLRQAEDVRYEAKDRLEETIASTFSQLRITFDALDAAMKGINTRKKINIEDIAVPTFGLMDDLKSFCSQNVTESSRELEEKRSQLNVEILELEIHAQKLQKLQDQEIIELTEKKNGLERRQQILESERKSKSKIMAEKVKAAEIEIERRKRQRAIEQQSEENLKRLQHEIVYEGEENTRHAEARRRFQSIISRMEDECREEVLVRLVSACEKGEISRFEFDENDVDRVVKQLVFRRINKMLNPVEY